jgi:hypothetical protein
MSEGSASVLRDLREGFHAQSLPSAGISPKTLRTPMYSGTLVHMTPEKQDHPLVEIERVQTGVRLEKRMLKVLKAIAEQKDMTLGDLLEGIVLHAFEGKAPFSPQTLKEIEQFKSLYGMTLKASDSHHLKERKR